MENDILSKILGFDPQTGARIDLDSQISTPQVDQPGPSKPLDWKDFDEKTEHSRLSKGGTIPEIKRSVETEIPNVTFENIIEAYERTSKIRKMSKGPDFKVRTVPEDKFIVSADDHETGGILYQRSYYWTYPKKPENAMNPPDAVLKISNERVQAVISGHHTRPVDYEYSGHQKLAFTFVDTHRRLVVESQMEDMELVTGWLEGKLTTFEINRRASPRSSGFGIPCISLNRFLATGTMTYGIPFETDPDKRGDVYKYHIDEDGKKIQIVISSNGKTTNTIEVPMLLDSAKIHDELLQKAVLEDTFNAPLNSDTWKDAHLEDTFGTKWESAK